MSYKESAMSEHEIFGDVISQYTRAQAIEDGVLVDLTGHKGTEIFRYPAAFTSALWAEIERGQGKDQGTREARVWDVCWMATKFARELGPTRRQTRVKIGARSHVLWADCGPGDDAEPVITIGFPEDF